MKSGQVDETWNQNEHKGIPFGSVVTIVTRKGNPKGIKTWDDLLKPGVEVVTPNPFSSGSAKWNLLAPYAEKSNGGQDPEAGLAYLDKLIGDHIKVQPKSGREATETFLQGTGDVLLSYENEALFAERNGEDVEHTTPAGHVQDREPGRGPQHLQEPGEGAGVRRLPLHARGPEGVGRGRLPPGRPDASRRSSPSDFPEPQKLWTIDDLGGWGKVNDELFEPETGSVAKIYDEATS